MGSVAFVAQSRGEVSRFLFFRYIRP